jgi:hypothetical protein
MKDLAEEVKDDLTVVVVPQSDPADLDLREERVRIEVCEYCGHCPCGCGG